jgi:SPP1 gp7 family putative phage head morphogenesis protein
MNKRQKQVIQSQLNDEKATLNKLKGIYKKALDDVNDRLAALKGRAETENLQSVIYQIQYQEALKKQINGILDTLNGDQFSTISEYLAKSYESGFVGVMYDIHGQGVPLIFPIDQDQVVQAVTLDTKLSKPLYNKLGEDVNLLKKRVANNISRGIAQGQSYSDIAKNIAVGMVGNYARMNGGALYNAMRITRTEAHRISQQAAYDALKKAKDNGADVMKQWDATLDKRTRPSHARVDGEIRELDEPFSNGLMKPGDPNGRAAEVINCRCQILQRARCALDEDELDELKERAAYFGLDKTADFEDFRRKYMPASIANSENSGIINYKEVYRKKSEQSNYGISQKRFDELTIEAKKNGATILRGTDEIEKHLDSVNAQAATLGDTMLFRKNVRVCDVLEESYHFMQNKKGINIDKTEPLRTYLNEIEAKQFIIDNERKYKVPRIEIEETKRQLSEYQKALKKWRDDNDL